MTNLPRRPGGPVGPGRPGGPVTQTWPSPGQEPLQPPTVLTIGDTIQFSGNDDTVPTSVTLIGSVDPQGQSGTWWFTYGTTPQCGTISASASITATTIPQAVTVTLTGLVVGTTYYFAAVAQTVGGLVQAEPLSFLYAAPSVPVTATTTVPNPTPSALTIPHLAWPFKVVYGTPHVQYGTQVTSNDGVNVVQQDSDGDVFSCVNVILNCQVGQWPENPAFGIHDSAFQQVDQAGLDLLGLTSTIQRWEPRATALQILSAASQGDSSGGNWSVDLEV